jgi:hypothetical protein
VPASPDIAKGNFRCVLPVTYEDTAEEEPAMHKRADGGVVESGRESRQGYLDRPILAVLIIGTGLALLVLGAMWLSL